MLDLRQLHHFLTLAEHGSISAAASVLGLTQPAVSENIAKLERKLDIQLVVRSPRGVKLTEAGRMLVAKGGDLLRASAALVENFQQKGEVSGCVSVGLPPALSRLLSVPLAETVHHELPNVRLHVAEGMSNHIREWIETERLDLGCIYEVPDHMAFETHPVLLEELFIVAAADNLPAGPDEDGQVRVGVEALRDLPFAMPSTQHVTRRILELYARTNGIALNVVMELDSLSLILEMVSRASAYTVLPHAAVASAAGQLALVGIAGSPPLRTAYLARKRSRPLSAASLAVERTMMKIMREMTERYRLKARLTDYAESRASEATVDPKPFFS